MPKLHRDSHAVEVGDLVHVFCCSVSKWVDAEVKWARDDYLRVEFALGEKLCSKMMTTDSEHLMIPARSRSPLSSSEYARSDESISPDQSHSEHREHDPEAAGVIRDLDWYTNENSIAEELRGGDVVLVNGGFLTNLAAEAGVLPCRQELPSEATWSVERFVYRRPQTVAISYCWYSADHPDPLGSQLQTISPFIKQLQAIGLGIPSPIEEVAVFWDYCSLYQRRQHHAVGPKKMLPLEAASMRRALQNMHFWYAHGKIHTWCQTEVPMHIRKYSERGWPTWELSVSLLLTGVAGCTKWGMSLGFPPRVVSYQEPCIFDLSQYPVDLFYADSVRGRCQEHIRKPPLTPEQFNTSIEQKTFSASDVDLPLIKAKYEEAFSQILGNVTTLCYMGFRWSAEDIGQLCCVLPCCHKLVELDISEIPIDQEGCRYLLQAIPNCVKLQVLRIDVSDENEDMLGALSQSCPNLDMCFSKKLLHEFLESIKEIAVMIQPGPSPAQPVEWRDLPFL